MSSPITPAGAAPASHERDGARNKQLVAAAQAFEAVFLRQMIGSMRQASLGEDMLGSSATDQFRDMSDSQLADRMAQTGRFGIAAMLIGALGTKDGAK